jgi:uncharacterized protein (DUF983 family)
LRACVPKVPHRLALGRKAAQFFAMQTISPATPPGDMLPPVIWKPQGRTPAVGYGALPMTTALWRGCFGECPACGKGRLFAGFLRVTPVCTVCAAPLGEIRADDAPPYFTIFIVAHLAIGLLVWLEHDFTLSVATEMMLFLPATLLATVALMRPVKGATIGAMLKLGFMTQDDTSEKALPDA